MTIKVEKRHYDAITGICKSTKRKFNADERDALEIARVIFAVRIADNVDGGTMEIADARVRRDR